MKNRWQYASLQQLVKTLQETYKENLRVLQLQEGEHPEVFRGFAVTQAPTLVLLRHGVEIWRQAGFPSQDLRPLFSERLLLA